MTEDQNRPSRRNVLAGAATLPLLAGQAEAAPQSDASGLVEKIMQSAVSTRSADFTSVRSADLRALCDAVGVKWSAAWWERDLTVSG